MYTQKEDAVEKKVNEFSQKDGIDNEINSLLIYFFQSDIEFQKN